MLSAQDNTVETVKGAGMTHKTPRLMRPIMEAFVFLPIFRGKMIAIGTRVQTTSVRIVSAAASISDREIDVLFEGTCTSGNICDKH